MNLPVTICIPLSSCGGKLKNDTELRFCLRSLERHFQGVFEVAIIGKHMPTWLTGVTHVECGGGLKTAIKTAAETYPDGFFWLYDDTCLIKDMSCKEMIVTPACARWSKIKSKWENDLDKIRQRLIEQKFDAVDYSRPHGPYWFDKSMVDEAFADWPGMKGKFPFETWILSKRRWPKRHGVVMQYYGGYKSPPKEESCFLNYSDKGNTTELRDWLTTTFPDTSRFETPESLAVNPYNNTPTRGIVTLAGGSIYATNAYINCRMLRNMGCTLPIEWCYLGEEMETTWLDIIRETVPGVKMVNLGGPAKDNTKSRGGWQAKADAILHSEFEEVLFLDADSFPLRDPSFLFDHQFFKDHDCVLWPDIHVYGGGIKRVIQEKYGVDVSGRQIESGQMMFHMAACREGLEKTREINRNSEDAYKSLYGDKDTFLIGAKQAGVNSIVNPHVVHRVKPSNLIQRDFDGIPMFAHLTGGKWRIDRIARITKDDYPHLESATTILFELNDIIRKNTIMHVKDTFSASETNRIINEDMYQIRPMIGHRIPVRYIVDIGGNAGAFTCAASEAYPHSQIIVIEPDPDLMEDIRYNTRNCAAKIHYVEAACVGRNVASLVLTVKALSRTANFISGTAWASKGNLDDGDKTIEVKTVTLPALLEEFKFPSIDILKIDAEGVEGEILSSLQRTGWMSRIHWIRGEWHGKDDWPLIASALSDTHKYHLQDSSFNGSMIAHNLKDT